jgi:hypothetical protein
VGGTKSEALVEGRRLLQRYQIDRLAGIFLLGRRTRVVRGQGMLGLG